MSTQERVSRLEGEQAGTSERVSDMRADMNSRFADLREDMNTRFAELRSDMNFRFNIMFGLMLTLIGLIVTLLLRSR